MSGNFSFAFEVVVASHIALCEECLATSEAVQVKGGALLERLAPVVLASDALSRALSALNAPPSVYVPIHAAGIFSVPFMQFLGGQRPKWRMLGDGIHQQILLTDRQGSLRLLYIPPGRKVPKHGHLKRELILVLQSSFSDCEGRFGVGDVEDASGESDHQTIAGGEAVCIYHSATAAPLRFHALIPRLLQPIFRI